MTSAGGQPSLQLQENIELAPYTTLGSGGRSRFFCRVESVEQLRDALQFSRVKSLPVFVLGGGSNVVVSDSGFSGLTIKLEILGRHSSDEGSDEVHVEAAAGESWDGLVEWSVQRGVAGLECLSGIPGSVGATPIQNVGAYGAEVAQTISMVRCVDRVSGDLESFSNKDCEFGYRSSRFKTRDRGRYVVVAVGYRLRKTSDLAIAYPELRAALLRQRPDFLTLADPVEKLNIVRSTVLMLRRSKSMVIDPEDPNSRSVGSFFINPVLTQSEFRQFASRCEELSPGLTPPNFPVGNRVKLSAAWLIEQSGFARGYRADGVGLSRNHALALVNLGGGSSELLRLADSIRTAVQSRFGINLEQEAENIA